MSDTIAAVSTALQLSAIGILRLSGDGCAEIAGRVFTRKNGEPLASAPNRKLVLGALHDAQGRVIDHCMAVFTRGPHSYTGEDTVELHCHGSPAVLAAGLAALYAAGARPAGRGEFTKRAFLNGRMDLTQAEAVIDLIESDSTDTAANAAGQVAGVLQAALAPVYDALTDLCSHFHAVLDYPDEDIDDFSLPNYTHCLSSAADTLDRLLATYARGKILRQGAAAAIVGKPNVGKSSILNALAGFERAIVTQIPGTTRDTIEEPVLLGNTRLRLIDTAGIRQTPDAVEAIGVTRARRAVQDADLLLFVCDGSQPLDSGDLAVLEACANKPQAVALLNKSDLGTCVRPDALPFPAIAVSAKTGAGFDELSRRVDAMFAGSAPCDGSILTNARQYDAVRRAARALRDALAGLSAGQTPDAVLTDVEAAMQAIGEVTGATVREDITARIFERFCVGK